MNKQLKQQIINVFTALKANISFKAFEAGVHSALSTPSILRHCDPEIMKQAGWVREDNNNKIKGLFKYPEFHP